ncbi:MAG: MFS transporter [Candidatus Eisenbacteria bacterium]|uniref:3-methyl-2-oxobutanoate dehydrogenase (2-methylpropanoyl-transferring) n=1 Tax=Eiseniibacteriota bacterium TaxID=2212470 RepID=A0A956LUY1_UNCEI|nr:MFS transporter [Candidatus Eisenbacteria bacterium]
MNKFNRAEIIDDRFLRFVREWGPRLFPAGLQSPGHWKNERGLAGLDLDEEVHAGGGMTRRDALEIFESQIMARHLDLVARILRARNASFYTIGSAGHEGNAVVGRLLRHTDPAFLHYRSGAFMMERARKLPEIDPIYDTILSQAASAEDPIAGGRHKVWGSKSLWVLPQTSTIASHLPKAVGTAIAFGRAKKLGQELAIPRDSVVVASFGDASTNHSTALGALNAAGWTAYQSLPVPILMVCEDNGIGISVRTPKGYLEHRYSRFAGMTYYRADGTDIVDTFEVAQRAIDHCRRSRTPVFLHLKVVRMLGHAGTDFEFDYRTMDEIEATEDHDPLLKSARFLLEAGLLTSEEILGRYETIRARCLAAADRAVTRPRLQTAAEVIGPLAPYSPEAVQEEAVRTDWADRRIQVFGGEDALPEKTAPKHLAATINQALYDLLTKYPQTVIFGEDVARKGGVYHVTAGLEKTFRPGRIFNTLLDEQSILGLAQGFGYVGLLPIAEIQYLAYFHNACDQIRGEACSMQFFSQDQFRNPMVVRIASLGYQKGFGGHFHNDNSTTALRDIPGLVIACPSRGDDAAAMLRTCLAMAKHDGRVAAFLEPIALYMTKDLYEDKDGGWQFPYPAIDSYVAPGSGRVYHEDRNDLAIITYGNGVYFSLRVARRLAEEGVQARVFDLRWLAPMDIAGIARHVEACGRALVVDEGRRSGGASEAIITAIVEHARPGIAIRRVVGEDTYIPLGPAANEVLPSEEQILRAARLLVDRVGTRA